MSAMPVTLRVLHFLQGQHQSRSIQILNFPCSLIKVSRSQTGRRHMTGSAQIIDVRRNLLNIVPAFVPKQ